MNEFQGWWLRAGIAMMLVVSAQGRPERFDSTLYGMDHLSLGTDPLTYEQLEKLERAAPDQAYEFDPDSVTRRLDSGSSARAGPPSVTSG